MPMAESQIKGGSVEHKILVSAKRVLHNIVSIR